jgi:hypothetical protein
VCESCDRVARVATRGVDDRVVRAAQFGMRREVQHQDPARCEDARALLHRGRVVSDGLVVQHVERHDGIERGLGERQTRDVGAREAREASPSGE